MNGMEEYKKSFAAAEYLVTTVLEPIISVMDDEELKKVLWRNLENACSSRTVDDYRMISDTFLNWFFDAFPYLYYGLLKDPETTNDLPKVLYKIAYQYYEDDSYPSGIVKSFDWNIHPIDFQVFQEEKYAWFCGKLQERIKVLGPVNDYLEDRCRHMMPSQRYHIGFVFCSFSSMLCELMHDEETKKLLDSLVLYMRSLVASNIISVNSIHKFAEENGLTFAHALDKLAKMEVWMDW